MRTNDSGGGNNPSRPSGRSIIRARKKYRQLQGYWDTSSGTRQRRLQRAKREAFARPPKRDNAMTQLTLDHHLGARGSHPQLTPGEQSTTKLVGASV